MSEHPSHLGGRRAAAAPTGNAIVRARVTAHRRNEQTRKWVLEVELRGGRRLRNITPTADVLGATSGKKPRLPGVNSWGLICFAESGYGVDGYWLRSVDDQEYGLDQDSAHEDINLFGSGYGTAVTEDGTATVRWPNGDVLVQGAGLPYGFQLRDPGFRDNRVLHDLTDLPVRNHYLLDARKGGALWGVLLVGGVKILADAAKRSLTLSLGETEFTLQDGLATLKADLLQVGSHPDNTVPVALWPETQLTLVALAKELHATKNKLVYLEAKVNRNQLILQTALSIFAPFLLPMFQLPPIPIPFITRSDKSGGLLPFLGGVQVVDGASSSVYGE